MNVRLGDILRPTKILNINNVYEPVAVGKYGIRKRNEIYKKQLANDYSKNKVIEYGSLIIGMGSTQIDVGVLCENNTYCVSPAYHTYQIDVTKVLPEYLEFLLMAFNPHFTRKYMIASARQGKAVDLKGLLSESITLPDFSKQRQVVERIHTFKEEISSRQETVTDLEELVKSLFNEAFINAAYPRVAIKTVCSKITDGTHKTPDYQNEGVRFISAKNISSGKLDLSDVKHITQEEYETIQKRCQLAKGDVLLAKSGTLGVSVLFEENGPFGLFESLAVLKPIPGVLDGRYLSEAIGSAFVQEQFSLTEVGVGVKHLHLNVISNTVIPLPPIDVQKAFAKQLQQIDKLRFNYQRQIELLQELMDKKMEEYFGGGLL